MMCDGTRWRTRLGAVLGLIASNMAWAGPATGPLRIHAANPRYFDDGTGKAIYLTGSHVWNNMVDWGPSHPPAVFNFTSHLNWLKAHNHNFTRGWVWEHTTNLKSGYSSYKYFNPPLFERTGPGNANDGRPKFDLTKVNPVYLDRLRGRLIQARDEGIYVGVMFFQLINYGTKRAPFPTEQQQDWWTHPFQKNNNINGIDADPNHDGQGWEFSSLPTDTDYYNPPISPAVLALQEAYIRAVIDHLHDLDNIIWEIGNEGVIKSDRWQIHMINFIKSYEQQRGYRRHLVWFTAMEDVGQGGNVNPKLFASPADVISPIGTSTAQGDFKNNPPALTGAGANTKINLLDTDHLCGICLDKAWVWKSFTRGYHPIFMDPYYGCPWGSNTPAYDLARAAMGHTRSYAERMDLATVKSQASGTATPSSTQYCLHTPNVAYIVYQPGSGAFTLDLPEAAFDYEWFNPTTGAMATTGYHVSTGGPQTFTPPFSGDAVLFVQDAGPTPTPGDLDLDGDVDQSDFGDFQECFSGSTNPYEPGCERSDLDRNGVVDQADAAMFLNCMGGANSPPGC